MERGVPTKVAGACLGLSGFAVAIIAGLSADNPADVILTRAILAMAALGALGQALGALAERAVDQRVAEHRAARPVRVAGVAERADDEPIDV